MKESFDRPLRKPTMEQTPGELLITKLGLNKGVRIRLNKISKDGHSEIEAGSSIEGVLDEDVSLNKSIFLDNRSKNTSQITAVKKENDRYFFKTNTSVYELVPPEIQPASLKPKTKELIELEKNIERKLKEVQANALTKAETEILLDRYFKLKKESQTDHIKEEIEKIDKKILENMVTVKTLIEFQILMNKLEKNYYVVNGTVLHENAHANKAESIGGTHGGYSIWVFKSEKKDGYIYQPYAHTDIPEYWPKHRKLEANIKIVSAPEEYGDRMSDGDEERLEDLKKELENNKNN
jgi:hypothetical protein